MQKIYIDIFKENSKIHDYYIRAYKDISRNYNIKIFLFSTDYKEEDFKNKEKLEESNIFLFKYSTEKDTINTIKRLNKKYNIIYINTFFEDLITLCNKIKNNIGKETTKYYRLFRNKGVQRKLLLNYDKKYTVNFLEQKVKDLNFKELKDNLGIPFILKPKDGIGSSGVIKIKDEKELKKYKNQNIDMNILIEEFIDGEMYSIDYFVNEKGEITGSNIVKILLPNIINIKDFFNLCGIISKKIEKEIKKDKLLKFIENTIKATGIKNTFIHHEFKLNSKGELKTIELNGRIGGYRLDIYQEGYGINLLDMIFDNKDYQNIKVKNDVAVISIYPEKQGFLKEYNYKLLGIIKKLKSFHSLRIFPEKYEGGEIGLTKDGFRKVGKIILKNKDEIQFEKDYDFIEKNYKNLLILE